MGPRGTFWVGMGPKGLVGKGESIQSMRLVWREVHILVQRATTPSEGLLFITLIAKHVLIIHCICCKYVFVLFIFSPLQVKNKPHHGGTKLAFILGPNSLVVSNWYQTIHPWSVGLVDDYSTICITHFIISLNREYQAWLVLRKPTKSWGWFSFLRQIWHYLRFD